MKVPGHNSGDARPAGSSGEDTVIPHGRLRRVAEWIGFAVIAGLLFWLAWTIVIDGELEAAQSASVYRFEGWQKILAVLPFTMGLGLSWALIRSAWCGLRGSP